jgi:hypothetical protein
MLVNGRQMTVHVGEYITEPSKNLTTRVFALSPQFPGAAYIQDWDSASSGRKPKGVHFYSADARPATRAEIATFEKRRRAGRFV